MALPQVILPLYITVLVLSFIAVLLYNDIVGGMYVIHEIATVFSITVVIIMAILITAPFIPTDRVSAEVLFDIVGCVLLLYTGQYYCFHDLYVKKKFKVLVTICNFGAAICLGVDAVLKIIKGKTSDAEAMEISSAEGGGKSRK